MSNCYIKFIKSINITPIKIVAVIKVNFLIKSIINPFFNYYYNIPFYLPYVKLSQVSFVFLFKYCLILLFLFFKSYAATIPAINPIADDSTYPSTPVICPAKIIF